MNRKEPEITTSGRMLEIVIIDNESISCLIQKLKIQSRFSQPVRVFEEACEALTFMAGATATDFLVLLDIDMPGMDGWDFLSEWQKIESQTESVIRIIMLSCSISSVDRNKALTYPQVAQYFEKPLYDQHLDSMEEVIASFRPEIQVAR